MTCHKPKETPINLSQEKSLCACIFKAKPLGAEQRMGLVNYSHDYPLSTFKHHLYPLVLSQANFVTQHFEDISHLNFHCPVECFHIQGPFILNLPKQAGDFLAYDSVF